LEGEVMAQLSLTELSSVTSFDRIDGEYYLPEYISNQYMLSRIETVSLPQWFLVSDGNHLSVSKHFSDSGEIPYFRGQDVNDFFLENADPIRIPKKINDTPMMRRSQFLSGDVLLSIVGTIGSLSFVSDTIGEAAGSCKIAILRSKGDCSPFFLATFLMSKFGQLQIKRNTRGAVQMGLILKDFSRIRVPKFSEANQTQIETIVKKAINLNRQSKKLYDKAQHLLESELGLDKLNFKKPVGYAERFSELEKSRRADSEFFNPKLRYYWKMLSSRFEMIPILKFVTVLKFSNPSYGTNGAPIVTQKHLRTICPEGYGHELRTTDSWQRANSTAILQYYDLLFYSVGAYLGKTNLWLNSDAAVPASFITLLRCYNENDAGFLHMVLNSNYGILQSKCFQSGTSQQYIYPKDIRKFLIPKIDDKLREKLNQLVAQSYENGIEAKILLNQAKSRVERLIEEAAAR